MTPALVLQFLPVVAGIFLSIGQTFIKGNKKYVIAILAYFLLKWIADKAALEAAKDAQQVKIDPITGDPVVVSYTNPTTLAKEYHSAFDPYNTGFLPYNGTDTDALFALAARTFNWGDVRSAYNTLYKRDLTEDLQDELSSDELVLFNQILNRSK